jgi:uncharacterized protein (DUF302 family)
MFRRVLALIGFAAALTLQTGAQAQTPYTYGYPGYPMMLPSLPSLPQFLPAPQLAPPAAAPVAAPFTLPQIPLPLPDNVWLENLLKNASAVNPLSLLFRPASGPLKPYTMRRIIPQEEKTLLMQLMMPMTTGIMRMDMAEGMNFFARKIKAKPGLSFDDVRDSLFLRANQVNMKKVGENLMWLDFKAVLGDDGSPRIEVYSFCDIKVGRDLLKISPEMVVFLPCRIAIMEDANKDIWVLMVDWDMNWVIGFEKKLGLSDELFEGAVSIQKRMTEMMEAAANGDI